ncbi:MAG: DMT family transporter [Betaproteobacteria bacterium]|nr:DMT family transporter [Betaproteobacteria bacterium]
MTVPRVPAVQSSPVAGLMYPALFVLLWSSGFIGAKLGLPYCGPLSFLALRYACVVVLMLPVCWIAHAAWPASWREGGHVLVAGALIQGGYLGGVFVAISLGMPAGVAALIVGLQPILTAFLSGTMVGERSTRRQWIGLALGFLGVMSVVWDKMALGAVTWASALSAGVALLSITYGTLYQKRHCAHVDMRTNSALQFISAFAVTAPFAVLLETFEVTWSVQFAIALGWMVFGLSLGAMFLLFWLIRRGAATAVASLIYLCPPTTAVLAWLAFGEAYTAGAAAGMVLTAAGVWLAVKP